MIITLLRKPLEGTVAENTLRHGCGSINIDDTRVSFVDKESVDFEARQRQQTASYKESGWSGHVAQVGSDIQMYKEKGRWPANVILTHKDSCESQGEDWACVEGCPVKNLDDQSGVLKSGAMMGSYKMWGRNGIYGGANEYSATTYGDSGVASRYFKQFKRGSENYMIEYFKTMITPPIEDPVIKVTSPYDFIDDGVSVHGLILLGEPTDVQAREIFESLKSGGYVVMIPTKECIGYKGVIALEDTGFEVRDAIFVAEEPDSFCYTSKASRSEREDGLTSEGGARANVHPTVKPIEIMEWCARDIESNSKVVDPFLGSGTTGIAMSRLRHDFVGIELNPEYAKICETRIRHWMPIGTKVVSEAQVGTKQTEKGQVSLFDS
jgi:hypothetical protein